MLTKSYPGKMFVVIDSDARVRDPKDLSKSLRYKAGDEIPADKKIGDPISIPKLAEINVTDVTADAARNVFVFAVSKADAKPFGWTRASNLKGQFTNETTGSSPEEFLLFPQGDNMTVVDAKALIRSGPPDFKSLGTTIPRGTFVLVTDSAETPKARLVKVSRARLKSGKPVLQEELGWTNITNLAEGWSEEYATDTFANPEGPNAAWRSGVYIGQKVLVDIVGTGGQLEQVTLTGLEAYLNLKDTVEAKENIILSIESGFRSFPRQAELRRLYEQHQGNLAAKPGFSNHQHGQAFDLNTTDRLFDKDPIYVAIKKHGPGLGFIRTVSGEPWHWEFRPADAAKHGFKMPGVNP